jgi:hypothetical protein
MINNFLDTLSSSDFTSLKKSINQPITDLEKKQKELIKKTFFQLNRIEIPHFLEKSIFRISKNLYYCFYQSKSLFNVSKAIESYIQTKSAFFKTLKEGDPCFKLNNNSVFETDFIKDVCQEIEDQALHSYFRVGKKELIEFKNEAAKKYLDKFIASNTLPAFLNDLSILSGQSLSLELKQEQQQLIQQKLVEIFDEDTAIHLLTFLNQEVEALYKKRLQEFNSLIDIDPLFNLKYHLSNNKVIELVQVVQEEVKKQAKTEDYLISKEKLENIKKRSVAEWSEQHIHLDSISNILEQFFSFFMMKSRPSLTEVYQQLNLIEEKLKESFDQDTLKFLMTSMAQALKELCQQREGEFEEFKEQDWCFKLEGNSTLDPSIQTVIKKICHEVRGLAADSYQPLSLQQIEQVKIKNISDWFNGIISSPNVLKFDEFTKEVTTSLNQAQENLWALRIKSEQERTHQIEQKVSLENKNTAYKSDLQEIKGKIQQGYKKLKAYHLYLNNSCQQIQEIDNSFIKTCVYYTWNPDVLDSFQIDLEKIGLTSQEIIRLDENSKSEVDKLINEINSFLLEITKSKTLYENDKNKALNSKKEYEKYSEDLTILNSNLMEKQQQLDQQALLLEQQNQEIQNLDKAIQCLKKEQQTIEDNQDKFSALLNEIEISFQSEIKENSSEKIREKREQTRLQQLVKLANQLNSFSQLALIRLASNRTQFNSLSESIKKNLTFIGRDKQIFEVIRTKIERQIKELEELEYELQIDEQKCSNIRIEMQNNGFLFGEPEKLETINNSTPKLLDESWKQSEKIEKELTQHIEEIKESIKKAKTSLSEIERQFKKRETFFQGSNSDLATNPLINPKYAYKCLASKNEDYRDYFIPLLKIAAYTAANDSKQANELFNRWNGHLLNIGQLWEEAGSDKYINDELMLYKLDEKEFYLFLDNICASLFSLSEYNVSLETIFQDIKKVKFPSQIKLETDQLLKTGLDWQKKIKEIKDANPEKNKGSIWLDQILMLKDEIFSTKPLTSPLLSSLLNSEMSQSWPASIKLTWIYLISGLGFYPLTDELESPVEDEKLKAKLIKKRKFIQKGLKIIQPLSKVLSSTNSFIKYSPVNISSLLSFILGAVESMLPIKEIKQKWTAHFEEKWLEKLQGKWIFIGREQADFVLLKEALEFSKTESRQKIIPAFVEFFIQEWKPLFSSIITKFLSNNKLIKQALNELEEILTLYNENLKLQESLIDLLLSPTANKQDKEKVMKDLVNNHMILSLKIMSILQLVVDLIHASPNNKKLIEALDSVLKHIPNPSLTKDKQQMTWLKDHILTVFSSILKLETEATV